MLTAKNTKRIFTAVLGFAVIFLIASTAQARSNDSGQGNSTAYSQQSPPPQRDSRPIQKSENREQKTENRITEKNIRVDSQASVVASRNEQRQQVAAPIQAEDRGQRTEVRSQSAEVRVQNPEYNRSQSTGVIVQRAENGWRPATGRVVVMGSGIQPATGGSANSNTQHVNTQTIDRSRVSEHSAIATRIGNDKKNVSSATQTRIEKPAVQYAVSTQVIAQNSTDRVAQDRSERRERIVRGTADREVSVLAAGRLMNADRAVKAVDFDRTRAVSHNYTTIAKNFDNHRDRHDNHDGWWWNRRHDDHRSNIFLSLGFASGYPYYSLSPLAYEPAVVTSAAYTTAVVYGGGYRTIIYHHGPHYQFSYVYPNYHRRYVFVSVGGYWPCYPYARYYWYDCHPWCWYGAAPVAYLAGGDTYNYYTYNSGSDNSGGALQAGTIVNGVQVPDYDALAAVGQRAAAQPQLAGQLPSPQQPAAPTESDRLFDEAVKAFGDQDYPAAIEKFQRAVRLEPNDVILPFAYAQALFANNDYEQAAAVLHTALNEMAPAKAEVFFPRGLYKDDNLLITQIKNLERAVMMDPANSELQLLYGYQLLGIGKTDEATVPLGVAKRDARTAGSASTLLDLIDRVKAESQIKK